MKRKKPKIRFFDVHSPKNPRTLRGRMLPREGRITNVFHPIDNKGLNKKGVLHVEVTYKRRGGDGIMVRGLIYPNPEGVRALKKELGAGSKEELKGKEVLVWVDSFPGDSEPLFLEKPSGRMKRLKRLRKQRGRSKTGRNSS